MTQFMVYGRNAGDWILLKDVSGLIYTTASQKKRIDLNNNTPYNHFKFENLKTGNPSNCAWIIPRWISTPITSWQSPRNG